MSCLFLRSRYLLPLIISEFKIQNFKFSNYSLHGCFVSRIVLIWGNTVMKYTLPLPSMMSYYSSSLQQKHNLKVYLFIQWETDMLTKMRKWYIKKIHLFDLYLKFVFTTMTYILMATFIFTSHGTEQIWLWCVLNWTPGASQGLKWFYYIPQVLLMCKVNPEC